MTAAEGHVHHQGSVGDGLAAAQGAGEQHIGCVGRELEHYAGARAGISCERTASGGGACGNGIGDGSTSSASSPASSSTACNGCRG